MTRLLQRWLITTPISFGTGWGLNHYLGSPATLFILIPVDIALVVWIIQPPKY